VLVATRKSKLTYRANERVPDPDPFSGRPPIDQIEIRHKTYLTAKVQPLDVTGVRTVTVGATLWLIALVWCAFSYDSLSDHGHGWWLWTCVAGFALGLRGPAAARGRDQPTRCGWALTSHRCVGRCQRAMMSRSASAQGAHVKVSCAGSAAVAWCGDTSGSRTSECAPQPWS
jgi:hypothetical protein